MPGIALPPFPDDVPTHPLLVIDYELIKTGNKQEIDKLWKAATELGFWYLKNHGADQEIEEMFDMGAETMAMPMAEKIKFEQGTDGQSFGYKAAGTNATDEHSSLDTVEFINVAKDDALAFPSVAHRTYPSAVVNRMERTIRPFVQKSLEVNNTILSVFERKLGLPEGRLLKAHAREAYSASEARVIKNPPKRPAVPAVTTPADMLAEKDKVALGAHTDFGSLSFLHNRLGGLQVLPQGVSTWQYVRPLAGHMICNVGDALTLFSGGILRSNLHRVVPPPGAQATHPRWSLVFFMRPANDVRLNALNEESELVKERIEAMNMEDKKKYSPDVTAREWFARRIRKQKIKNRTVSET